MIDAMSEKAPARAARGAVAGCSTPVAVLHLGRNGGGPKFTWHLTEAIAASGQPVVSVIAATADNRSVYDRVGPVLPLATFSTATGALLRAPLMLLHGLRLRRFLDRHGVDVVVVAMEQIWQAPILALAKGRRKVLLCVHDATMHPGTSSAVERATLRMHRALADGALTFSEHVASTLTHRGVFPESRVWRSVHGSYLSSDRAPRGGVDTTVPVIGFFGRLAAYKGLGVAYEAIRILRGRGRRVRFRVVGDGQDPALASLHHEDDEARIGWIDDASIPALLDGFDLLVLPYTEASQSGVFAYAMGRGLPMVVTPVGGLVEQAATGAALIADSAAPVDVAEALAVLLDDADRYREASAAGLAASRDTYSWSRTAADALGAARALVAIQDRFA